MTLADRGNATEERITNESGGAKGSKQARFDQVPTRALYELAEHTGKGTAKYPDKDGVPNFRFGYAWGLSYAAAMRHMVQFWNCEDIDEETLRRYLYDPETPDPDLMVRTAGEMRVSNFLLWQMSYSELYVTDACWPDFRREHLAKAVEEYQQRNRRFGALDDDAPAAPS